LRPARDPQQTRQISLRGSLLHHNLNATERQPTVRKVPKPEMTARLAIIALRKVDVADGSNKIYFSIAIIASDRAQNIAARRWCKTDDLLF
jgi:hypothetical protein